MRLAIAASFLVLLSQVACKDSGPEITASGTWSGSTGSQTISMTIADNGGTVTGSGTISSSSGPRALTITGSFTKPTLSVTLQSGIAPPANLAGDISGNTLSGTLNGSGFNNTSITMTRSQ
jgi:hypothetical protein